jgi:hypothetical protein
MVGSIAKVYFQMIYGAGIVAYIKVFLKNKTYRIFIAGGYCRSNYKTGIGLVRALRVPGYIMQTLGYFLHPGKKANQVR